MTSTKSRLTAQGIRDLNYYGPRRVAAVVVAETEPKIETDAPLIDLPAEPTVPVAVTS
ncbi:MAG TPA: hypothetical protein VH374_13710 [Polyangia bacterium]|jgi:hypothetical protein|nr:hypothetical protein [Polyangia bacterium]